jgi:hypothetical protein
VAEVLGHLVQRPALVQEQRRAGVAQVVAAEVRDAGALERGDPDAAPPVVAAEVAALAVREHELLRGRAAPGEIELEELARDRLEQLRLASAL